MAGPRGARAVGGGGGGVTRVAWSPELFAATLVRRPLRELGLEVEVDAAGNLLASWSAGEGPGRSSAHTLTPCPRAAVSTGRSASSRPPRRPPAEGGGLRTGRPLWVVAFMDEEGTRFDAALFGSRAFTGEDVTGLGERVDATASPCARRWPRRGTTPPRSAERDRVGEVGAYLELHIEQGPVLEAAGIQIGVVTSIVGLRGYRVAAHAARRTTPARRRCALRRDALAGAARIALELREAARAARGRDRERGQAHGRARRRQRRPGPGRLHASTCARRRAAGLAELEQIVEETVARIAAEEALDVELQQTFALEPLELDPMPRRRRRARRGGGGGERRCGCRVVPATTRWSSAAARPPR